MMQAQAARYQAIQSENESIEGMDGDVDEYSEPEERVSEETEGRIGVSPRAGRSGRQARIKAIENDPKESSANRGGVKNETRRIQTGNGSQNYRMPNNGRKSPGRKAADKGLELAHPNDAPASRGNSYSNAKLKNHADHKVETRLHRQSGRY